MLTLGFTFSYSDLAVAGTLFPYPSTYIYVQVQGDIVYQAPDGTAQWIQAAAAGYHPISAIKILTSGIVNGVSRTTSATGIMYCSAPIPK